MKKIYSLIKNLCFLALPAVLLFLLTMEIAARSILSPSDFPDVIFDPLLGNHFAPNQAGVFIKGPDNAIRAQYRINSSGWNSPRDYVAQKNPDVFRIAVIGDSYIEGLHVDYDKSYPNLLEKYLNKKFGSKMSVEVYGFGHSGAHLVQYLNVIRQITKTYTPDLVIVNIIHNDFMESLQGFGRVDFPSLKRQGEQFLEVSPSPSSNLRMKRFIRNFALARFLIINMDMISRFATVKDMFYGKLRPLEQTANIEVSDINFLTEEKLLEPILQYLFSRYQNHLREINSELLLVLDGNRGGIYAENNDKRSKTNILMQKAGEVAKQRGIQVIDLTNDFRSAWNRDGKKFEWEWDGHWNAYAHQLVAESLTRWIPENSSSFGKLRDR